MASCDYAVPMLGFQTAALNVFLHFGRSCPSSTSASSMPRSHYIVDNGFTHCCVLSHCCNVEFELTVSHCPSPSSPLLLRGSQRSALTSEEAASTCVCC